MCRPFTFLIAIILCTYSGVAQQDFRFDHITINDGLSQSQAYCIFQDSRGYMWVGTQDGLNRYDGYDFKIFKNDPFDSTTLSHNWVWSVEEDDNGDLWVGTFQGLCRYIRNEDRFEQLFHDMEDTTSISGNRPNYILKDTKGRIWISSWGSGLNLYDSKTKSFRRFQYDNEDPTSISSNAVRTLYCDSKGQIWAGTWNAGLNRVIEDEKGGISFQRYSPEPEINFGSGNQITSITEDAEQNLWVGSYESGLLVLDASRTTFRRIPDFAPNDVNKLFRDHNKNIWIGSNSGLYYFDNTLRKFRHYTHMPGNENGISSNTIYAINEDRTGIVWVAASGLDLYNPQKNLFKTFSNDPTNQNSLAQNSVWSFCEDDEKKIWIGTETGPINVFDPATKTFHHVAIRDNRGELASNIRKIVYDNGIFWIASFGSGLIRYEKATGRSTFYAGGSIPFLDKNLLVDELITDRDGTLWVSSNESGLIHFDPRTNKTQRFNYDANDPASLGSNFINSIYQDKLGNIWVGFWGGGMSMYDKKTGKFKNYIYDRKNEKGLSDQVVLSVMQDNDSIFWICTHTGLNRLNVTTGEFTHFFEKDGLGNNVTYEIRKDGQGNLWISTNGGLSKMYPTTNRFKNFTVRDGLQSNEFNSNAALVSSTGDFYFGGINGFNVFRPEQFKADTVPPRLLIDAVKVFDRNVSPAQDYLKLDYDENYLTFQFTAIEFSSPEKISYLYMLEGLNNQWIESGDERLASYTNLDPGHYRFRVKAANADGVWNEGKSLSFVIHPPFWKTWWFMLAAVLISLALMYSIHRYRLSQSLKVERLRNKIASDLHDEVGSSLTRISIYSDLLQTDHEAPESKGYLRSISDLSREIVGTMSDIVWSIDNRNDSLGAVILRMKDFATEVLQAKNIDMEFNVEGVDETRTLDPALKQNLYLIFKESINNIVKHAKATSVNVTIVNRANTFTLVIRDNGKGFHVDGSQKGNGLRNMERRAKAIGGEFRIENTQGTTITVQRRSF